MEENNDLYQTWSKLCNTYTQDTKNVATIYNQLIKSYSEPHRYYHTLDHVRDLVHLINECDEVENKEMLLFAAFFHDVVYSPGSKSNEKESCVMARAAMAQLAVPQVLIEETARIILQTKAHADVDKSIATNDVLLFLDIDLSILGADSHRYKLYAAEIRREFKKFPDTLYNSGRRNFLKGQLELPVIFHTKLFRERFELQARMNIERELKDLL